MEKFRTIDGKINLPEISNYLINNYDIVFCKNKLYIKHDGVYSKDTKIIEKIIINIIPNTTRHWRREILAYVSIICKKVLKF